MERRQKRNGARRRRGGLSPKVGGTCARFRFQIWGIEATAVPKMSIHLYRNGQWSGLITYKDYDYLRDIMTIGLICENGAHELCESYS